MRSRFRFARVGILISVGAVLFTCGCHQAAKQPRAAAASIEDAPQIGAVSPNSGTGRSQAFRLVVSHPAGATAIANVQLLIDEKMTPTAAKSCWIDVDSLNRVAARTEDGSGWLPSVPIGSAKTPSNNQCSVDASGVKVETNGPELAVTLPVTFAHAFKRGKEGLGGSFGAPQAQRLAGGWSLDGGVSVNSLFQRCVGRRRPRRAALGHRL
jgi:hypothetical protein